MTDVGARSSRRVGLPLLLAMVLTLLVSQISPAEAQAGCGGLGGFNFGGNFQGGGLGGFNFGGGNFQGGFNFSGLNFSGALTGFGGNFGGRPGCGTGVFGLIPDTGTIDVGQPLAYRLVWVVPGNWQDLEYLDLRIRDSSTVLLVRWFQASNTFAVVDPLTGQLLDSGPARANQTLRTPAGTVNLRGSYAEDSGPTGQAVGINVELVLAQQVEGHQLSVDVGAKQDGAASAPYEFAAILSVAARSTPNDGNKDDDDRKLTEQQHQQRERTNRAGPDEYRTEGNAVSAACDDPIPSVTIANRDGNVVLHLLHDARQSCELVRPGDYVEGVGEKQHEQLYEVDQLTVRRNGARVR